MLEIDGPPTVLVPCAGNSTRYPDMKPKYLLYDHEGQLMFKKAVESYFIHDPRTVIYAGIRKEHMDKFDAHKHIRKAIPYVRIIPIDEETLGPAHTVSIMLQNINEISSFIVKDCDNFFSHFIPTSNFICTVDVENPNSPKDIPIHNKSFVRTNEQDEIIDIVEKRIVSSKFCAGAYGFLSSDDYEKAFLEIKKKEGVDIYVSDVIQKMFQHGHKFSNVNVETYVDVGTAKEWASYTDKPVIFCDIDGTVVEAQSRVGRNSYSDFPIPLSNNIEALKKMIDKGAQVIFTTSRPSSEYENLVRMLKGLKFSEFSLITGLNNSRRILINDFCSHAPYPRAEAINIPRNSDTLGDYLK